MLSMFFAPGMASGKWHVVSEPLPGWPPWRLSSHAKQSRARHEKLFASGGWNPAIGVGNPPKIAERSRTSGGPGMAVLGGQNDAVPAHSHEGAIAIGDVLQAIIRSRITGGPPNAFSGSNNRAGITHGHKDSIAASDAAQAIVGSGILAGPRDPIRGGHDGAFVAHSHEDAVAVGDAMKGRRGGRSPIDPVHPIDRSSNGLARPDLDQNAVAAGQGATIHFTFRALALPGDAIDRTQRSAGVANHREAAAFGEGRCLRRRLEVRRLADGLWEERLSEAISESKADKSGHKQREIRFHFRSLSFES